MLWLYLLVPLIILLGAAVVINRRRRRSISYDSESAARLTGDRANDSARHFGGAEGGG
jgi:hypothetical protein